MHIIARYAQPKQFAAIINHVKNNDDLTRAFVDALYVKNSDEITGYEVFIEHNSQLQSRLDHLTTLNAMNAAIPKCKDKDSNTRKKLLNYLTSAKNAYRDAPATEKLKKLAMFYELLNFLPLAYSSRNVATPVKQVVKFERALPKVVKTGLDAYNKEHFVRSPLKKP